MQLVLEQILLAENPVRNETDPFGRKIGLLASLFGCRHKRLTRPFTNDKNSYMACVECGARRKFDAQNFKVSRTFYYPLITGIDRH